MDLTQHIQQHAKTVYLSQHIEPPPITDFMPNVIQKRDVQRYTATGAIFKDGSSAEFNTVIYCTSCKYTACTRCLHVHDNFVYPLYKHCININYTSMVLIGLPFYTCPSQLFDLQSRFVLKFLLQQKALPTQTEMLADTERDLQERWASGLKKRQSHQMGDKQNDYYNALAQVAEFSNIKPVIVKIMNDCMTKYLYELEDYPETCFRIVDAESYVTYPLKRAQFA